MIKEPGKGEINSNIYTKNTNKKVLLIIMLFLCCVIKDFCWSLSWQWPICDTFKKKTINVSVQLFIILWNFSFIYIHEFIRWRYFKNIKFFFYSDSVFSLLYPYFMQETSVISSYTVYQEPIKYFFFQKSRKRCKF